jgi:hypothetical protein
MAEFTLLKLQFEDASFTANAPFSGRDEADIDTELEDGGDEGGPGLLPLVIGLVFLVALVVVVRKLRGNAGEDDGETVADD